MKKMFFFLRHNNDIDHIVPVVYKWVKTQDDVPVDVIIYSHKHLLDDYRIKFLRDLGVNVYYVGRNLSRKHPSFLEKKAMERFSNKLFNENSNGGVLVFNWTVTPFVKHICKLAEGNGFVTVSLPHGDSPYVSKLKGVDDLDFSGMRSYEALKIFDYVVVPNGLCYDRYSRFMGETQIRTLGSPRYCDEWLKIVNDLLPVVSYPVGKLKIVLFLRNRGYPVFWDEVVRTIRMVSSFDGVFLVVKHHTRGNSIARVSMVKQDNIRHVYDDVPSGSLIRWADLVVDLGTSAVWDAVKQNKPVIVPEYLFANRSTVVEFMSSCEAKCRDDLFHMIENGNMYSEFERKQFIKNVIDVPDRFVLERYVKFFKEVMV